MRSEAASSGGYSRSVSVPLSVRDATASIAELNLPAGKYVIVAKAWFENVGLGAATTSCSLQAETTGDKSDFTLATGVATSAPFVLVHSFSAAGTATLTCTDGGGVADVTVREIRITPMKVATLTES